MPTRSISGVRMHFWQVVTRLRGGVSSPVKILFHRRHAGVDEQQALVVNRHQRVAGQAGMALAFKKGEELLAQAPSILSISFCSSCFLCFHFPGGKKNAPPHDLWTKRILSAVPPVSRRPKGQCHFAACNGASRQRFSRRCSKMACIRALGKLAAKGLPL